MQLDELTDPRLREQLAEQSYYRDRVEEAARDREVNNSDETVYMALRWDCLSSDTQRPYRTAVETCLDWVSSQMA